MTSWSATKKMLDALRLKAPDASLVPRIRKNIAKFPYPLIRTRNAAGLPVFGFLFSQSAGHSTLPASSNAPVKGRERRAQGRALEKNGLQRSNGPGIPAATLSPKAIVSNAFESMCGRFSVDPETFGLSGEQARWLHYLNESIIFAARAAMSAAFSSIEDSFPAQKSARSFSSDPELFVPMSILSRSQAPELPESSMSIEKSASSQNFSRLADSIADVLEVRLRKDAIAFEMADGFVVFEPRMR